MQVPAGRALQRPPWQVSVEPQSMSAVQPITHLLLMHQAPMPHSALNVQLEGTPPPVPPLPPVPVPPLWPPAPPVPLPPPVPVLPPVPASEPLPPPVPLDAGAQKPLWQLSPVLQS